MFDLAFLKKVKYSLIFIVIYTLLFFAFFSTLNYTFPFVMALIIALTTRPLTRFLRIKLKLSRSISALISTLIVFTILFIVVTIIVMKVTYEARLLLSVTPDFEAYKVFIQTNLEKLKSYYDLVDPVLIQRLQEQLTSLVSKSYDLVVNIISSLLSLAIGLPVVFMIIFITLIATYFFSRDILDIGNNFLSAFSSSGRDKVRTIWHEGGIMLGNYVRSYSIILLLTFTETFIGFSLIGVKYTLLLSLLAALVDILPVLGISATLFPVAAYYMFTGRVATGVVIIGLWALISIVRQIVEPKLISSSLGLHPLAVLAALYIGLAAYGVTGMLYLIFLMVFYNILRKVRIL